MEWNLLCNFGRVHQEEQLCEIILNLDEWFRRKCVLRLFLTWSSGSPFVQWSGTICAISYGLYEEQFCEIILNLGDWFRRCGLKDFLSGALGALLLCGAESFQYAIQQWGWVTSFHNPSHDPSPTIYTWLNK